MHLSYFNPFKEGGVGLKGTLMKVQLLQYSGPSEISAHVFTILLPWLNYRSYCFFFSKIAWKMSTVCLSRPIVQVLNIDLKAALNFVYFLFRVKILIIAVPGGSSDELIIKMHLIVEWNKKATFNCYKWIAESGMDKTLFVRRTLYRKKWMHLPASQTLRKQKREKSNLSEVALKFLAVN